MHYADDAVTEKAITLKIVIERTAQDLIARAISAVSLASQLPISGEIERIQGQLQASSVAGIQPPVQTGSPKALMVADPYISAEQNACPNALIMHFPGPHSIFPS